MDTAKQPFQKAGLNVDYIEDNQITVFTLADISRETIDTWADFYGNLMKNTPPDRSYFVLMDTTRQNLAFSPYFRNRTQMLINNYRHKSGYLAIVFANHFIKRIVQLFMIRQSNETFRSAYFVSYEQALAWLKEKID